jgi:hypothetical protein
MAASSIPWFRCPTGRHRGGLPDSSPLISDEPGEAQRLPIIAAFFAPSASSSSTSTFHVDDPGPEALAEASGAIDARVEGWAECVPDEPEAPDQIHVTTPEDLHGSERYGSCLPKARVAMPRARVK